MARRFGHARATAGWSQIPPRRGSESGAARDGQRGTRRCTDQRRHLRCAARFRGFVIGHPARHGPRGTWNTIMFGTLCESPAGRCNSCGGDAIGLITVAGAAASAGDDASWLAGCLSRTSRPRRSGHGGRRSACFPVVMEAQMRDIMRPARWTIRPDDTVDRAKQVMVDPGLRPDKPPGDTLPSQPDR